MAETASGMALAMHIPDGKVPVLKAMHLDYVKRSTGGLTATSQLTEQQITMLHQDEKGTIQVACEVYDDAQIQPVTCQMDWAWTPRR